MLGVPLYLSYDDLFSTVAWFNVWLISPCMQQMSSLCRYLLRTLSIPVGHGTARRVSGSIEANVAGLSRPARRRASAADRRWGGEALTAADPLPASEVRACAICNHLRLKFAWNSNQPSHVWSSVINVDLKVWRGIVITAVCELWLSLLWYLEPVIATELWTITEGRRFYITDDIIII